VLFLFRKQPTCIGGFRTFHEEPCPDSSMTIFGSLDEKITEMLPAPHTTFYENTDSSETGRAGRKGRRAVVDDSINPTMTCRPRRIFGPIAGFLGARIGARWSLIAAELCSRLGSEIDVRSLIPQLSDLVELHVVSENGQLCHGSGLLKGQPLQAGWRRRLYVCPTTGRLKRIDAAATRLN
jgi:hypothetical protein